MRVWLVGAGSMSRDYAKVLRAFGVDVLVIGRGEASAAGFEDTTSMKVVRGGLDAYLRRHETLPDAAIVSVGLEALASTTAALLHAGVKKILVEKPAALYPEEMSALDSATAGQDAAVYVGYNRRFYGSVRTARRMIEDDGGVQSFNFEFTEWAHEVEGFAQASVMRRWVLGNSVHVIDLAFHLGGAPAELHSLRAGTLSWHPAGSVFAGSGKSVTGALFSYQANWSAPGRWAAEFCTSKHRYIFKPMEALQLMRKGSVATEPVTLVDGELDKTYKPGLFLQVKEFLFGDGKNGLCSLAEHASLLPAYNQIAGY